MVDKDYIWDPSFGGTGAADADGNPVLPWPITTTASNFQGIPAGTQYPAGTQLAVILRQLLTPLQTPSYTAPTLSISANATSGEIGSTANITITPNWQQNDAGAVALYSIFNNGINIWSNLTVAARVLTAHQFGATQQSITAQVSHIAGVIKNDSNNQPFPAGSIPAGVRTSNAVTLTSFRNTFFETYNSVQANPTTSAGVRALAGRTNTTTTRQFLVSIPVGTRTIVIAIPKDQGILIEAVNMAMPGLPITAAFVPSAAAVNVEGANGYAAAPYDVYRASFDANTTIATQYRFTIG